MVYMTQYSTDALKLHLYFFLYCHSVTFYLFVMMAYA